MTHCKKRLKVSMLNKPLSVLFCIAILALTHGGCTLVPGNDTAKPELKDPVRVKVDLAEVRRGTLTVEMNGVGVVVPSKTDYLSFEIDGKLGEAAIRQGDRVRKGDVLFRLDAGNFGLQLMQQQLAVGNMQAVLDNSLAAGKIDDIRIEQMNLVIERMKLDRLLARQGKQVLVSPSSGIVTFMDDVRVGGPIAAYRAVVGIAHTDQLQLSYVGDLSAYSSRLEIGMPAAIQYKGTLAMAKVAVTPRTAPIDSYPQRAEILGKTVLFDFEDAIPASMSIGDHVEFKLELARKQDALIIPRGALRNYKGRDFVLIADGETRRETDVQPGLVTPTEVEIVRGLSEGQQVVVNQ